MLDGWQVRQRGPGWGKGRTLKLDAVCSSDRDDLSFLRCAVNPNPLPILPRFKPERARDCLVPRREPPGDDTYDTLLPVSRRVGASVCHVIKLSNKFEIWCHGCHYCHRRCGHPNKRKLTWQHEGFELARVHSPEGWQNRRRFRLAINEPATVYSSRMGAVHQLLMNGAPSRELPDFNKLHLQLIHS